MSAAYQKIYDTVRMIPAGRVATYGLLAALLNIPGGGHAVGFAMAACRDETVPCHRVVDRNGGTKKAFDVYGVNVQRALLEEEGVVFTDAGNVDLEICLWQGPEDLPAFTA